MQLKSFFASSVDPAEISLSIESASKVLIGLIGWWAVSKGMDAATAQSQLQAIVDLIAQAVPVVFTLWNTMLTVWGLVRKLYVYLFSTAPASA